MLPSADALEARTQALLLALTPNSVRKAMEDLTYLFHGCAFRMLGKWKVKYR